MVQSKLNRPFKPMLAGEADVEKLVYPVLGSPKLDGIRVIIKDRVVLSRSLKPIPNAYIQKLFGREEFEGFDGELTVGEPSAPNVMQTTMSGVMSADGTPDVRLHVFDLWHHPEMPFEERLGWLFRYLSDLNAIIETTVRTDGIPAEERK